MEFAPVTAQSPNPAKVRLRCCVRVPVMRRVASSVASAGMAVARALSDDKLSGMV
jgi:hypothetical protein